MTTAGNRADSFAPLLPPQPRLLILGSSPGRASLQLQQYYGHSRNAFWPIMARLLGHKTAPDCYAGRLALLHRAQIALWDVLASCHRPGSLDSDIDRQSERPNDIAGLLRQYPSITWVGCNGNKALEAFRRHILPDLSEQTLAPVRIRLLPSTSPANARLNAAQKQAIWHSQLMEVMADVISDVISDGSGDAAGNSTGNLSTAD